MVGIGVSLGISLGEDLLQNMVVENPLLNLLSFAVECFIFKSCKNHLSIGLPLLASKVDEGSDLVDGTVGQCNGVDGMVGNGDWGGVVDEGGVVDDRGNVMEDRVGDHLVAHLFVKSHSGGNIIVDSPQRAPQRQT